MFFGGNYFYYLTIGLQAICVIHCLKKGTQNKWIWLIVFLPVIGSLAYIFMEMFSGNELKNVQSGIGSVINPGGRVKKLEEQLRFSDTFNNRVMLADAYLQTGNTNRAIELYESSLTGAFTENEHVLTQLILAYAEVQRYNDILKIYKKVHNLPQFARSKAHMLYAIALEKTGNSQQAEKEFIFMKGRYAYFEQRYEYGMFLQRAGRTDEARNLFKEMLDEAPHLSARERKYNYQWFSKVREELRKMQAA